MDYKYFLKKFYNKKDFVVQKILILYIDALRQIIPNEKLFNHTESAENYLISKNGIGLRKLIILKKSNKIMAKKSIFHLFIYKKTCILSDNYKYLFKYASNYSKKNISQKNTYKGKCTSLVDDFLLRKFIYDNYKFKYDNKEIIVNDFGKPIFSGKNKYYFNFSHNDKYGVIVLGRNPVGVDVEDEENMDTKTKIIFMSNRELSIKNNTKLFLCKCWTAKESYCKATGFGLNISPKEVEITIAGSDFIASHKTKNPYWFVKHIILPEKTVIAVCSNSQFSLKYTKINLLKYLSSIINKRLT